MANWYIKNMKEAGRSNRDVMLGLGLSTLMSAPAVYMANDSIPADIPDSTPALRSHVPQVTEQPESAISPPKHYINTQPEQKKPTNQVAIDIGKIIQIESNGKEDAVSGVGASGIMQIMPQTWNEIVKKMGKSNDPQWSWEQGKFDKRKNIEVGTYYMNVEIPRLLRAFGVPDSIETRLAAYNWGIGGVRKAYNSYGENWLSFAPQETQNYVRKYNR